MYISQAPLKDGHVRYTHVSFVFMKTHTVVGFGKRELTLCFWCGERRGFDVRHNSLRVINIAWFVSECHRYGPCAGWKWELVKLSLLASLSWIGGREGLVKHAQTSIKINYAHVMRSHLISHRQV